MVRVWYIFCLCTCGTNFLKAPLIWYQLYIVLSSLRKKKYSREPNMIDMRSGNSNHVPCTVASILLPSLNIGIRGGYHGCQLVEVYKTFVYLEKYSKA